MDEKEPLISIIVPVYNVEDYIEECLESLVKQTYKNLEIILIDDGSTDNSGKICDDYVLKDTRIKCFHQINQGVGAARNKGLEVAEGELIGFVDPDDFCDLGMFQKLYGLMKKMNTSIACCLRKDMNQGKIDLGGYIFQEKEKICTRMEVLNIYTKSMDWSVCNKLYSREILKGINFPEVNYAEDFFTVFRWINKADKIAYLREGLYYYRMNRLGSATSSRDDLLLKIDATLMQLKKFQSFLIVLNSERLKTNFDIKYLHSLYDLRCNVENTEYSEEKITLLNKIKLEIKNLDMYKNSLGRSKCLKLFLLDNFKCGYSLLVIWEKLFKNIEKKN